VVFFISAFRVFRFFRSSFHAAAAGNPLKVLDIGTGPGFFAMLTAEMGHKVTATDCTQNMLLEAQNNIQRIGLKAEFFLMCFKSSPC